MTDDSRRRRFAARGAVAAAVLALPMTASICYVGAAPAQASALPVAAPDMTEVVAPIPSPGELAKPVAPELVFLDEDGLIEVALERRELADKQREQAEERRERAEEQRERAWEMERERQWERARTSYAQGRQQWAAGRVEYARSRQQWADGRLQWAENRVEHSKEKAKRKEAKALASAGWSEDMGEAIAHSVSTAVSHVPEVINDCRYPETPVQVVEKASGKITMFVCESAGDRIALKALISARAEMAADDEMPANFREEILRDLDREIKKLKKELRSAA